MEWRLIKHGDNFMTCDAYLKRNALKNSRTLANFSQEASKNRIPFNICRMGPEHALFSLLPHPIICIHQMETFKKEHLHCVDLIFYRPSVLSTVLTQYTLHSISFVDCPLFLSSLYLSFSVFQLLIPFR